MPQNVVSSQTFKVGCTFLAAIGDQDYNRLGSCMHPDVVMNACNGLQPPLGGLMTSREQVLEYYRHRTGLNIQTKIVWSIHLVSEVNFVIYGLMNYSNAQTGISRLATLGMWLTCSRGLISQIHLYIDSAPMALVHGTIKADNLRSEDLALTTSVRESLTRAGELYSSPHCDFSAVLDRLGDPERQHRAVFADLLSDEAEWFGPDRQLAGSSLRLRGRDAIRQHLASFDLLYEQTGSQLEASAQAEDTLVIRRNMDLRSLSTGKEFSLPHFMSLTMNQGQICRVVEVFDSLQLLISSSEN